jgi:hypothetical protein
MHRMSRSVLFVSLILALLVSVVAASMPADAAVPIRPITPLQARHLIAANPCTAFRFGAAPRSFAGPHLPGDAVAARVGRHTCFDRLVVDIEGGLPGWSVAYHDRLIQDASGQVIPLRGTKVLEIILFTNGHNINTGRPTLTGLPRPNFPVLRDAVLAADFEGQLQLGLGTQGTHPFRVFTLPGARGHTLWILDVKH